MIIYYAFSDGSGGFTIEYITAIATSTNIHAILLSLKLGILCTLVCLLLSYPLAMILNGMKIKNQSFIVFIFMLPMWMNFMLRILAWKQLLSKNGVINSILTTLGLPGFNIMNTTSAVVLGMVYDFLPFMLLPIYNSMNRIKNDWIEAARDLGANNIIIFLKIIVPLTLSGVISGIVGICPSLTSFAIIADTWRRKSPSHRKYNRTGFCPWFTVECRQRTFSRSYGIVLISMAIVNLFDKEGDSTAVW